MVTDRSVGCTIPDGRWQCQAGTSTSGPIPRQGARVRADVFAVNHLAPFLLTHLLLGRLRDGSPSRIVNVASDAHRWGRIEFEDLGRRRRYRGMAVYAQSKLANVLFTYELARRLEGTAVTANCLHPGAVATALGHNNGPVAKLIARALKPFFRTPEQG